MPSFSVKPGEQATIRPKNKFSYVYCLVDFSKRSNRKELLDRDDIPFPDIRRNMEELEFINAHLGGHRITLDGLKRLVSVNRRAGKELVIAEIGCGGGDNLNVIQQWCDKIHLSCRLIGIDINPNCIEVAKIKLSGTNHLLIASDFRQVDFKEVKPDIIFSSLFCHHFSDEELTAMLRWMGEHCGTGFFINDLERHPFAYYAIRLLSRLFSKSYLVIHDAPLSVLRGFTRKDWEKLLSAAGISKYDLRWKWAFRYLLTVPVMQN